MSLIHYSIIGLLCLGCLVGGFYLVRAISEVIKNQKEFNQLNNK